MTFFSTATAEPTAVAPSPLVCSLPDLPAPSLPPSSQEEWKRSSASIDDTVYGLAWQGQHLVAVTSSGEVRIWNVPSTNDDHEDMNQVERLEIFQKQRRPVFK